jgi:hypothetical protein
MADLISSGRRVGPAIGLTWFPRVSHHARMTSCARLTGAGLVHRIQPSVSVGEGTLERYNGARFQI